METIVVRHNYYKNNLCVWYFNATRNLKTVIWLPDQGRCLWTEMVAHRATINTRTEPAGHSGRRSRIYFSRGNLALSISLANLDFWVNVFTFAPLQKKLRGAHQICSKKGIKQVNVMADLWSYGPNSVASNSVYWHPIFLVDFENTRFEMPGVYLSIRKSLSS